MSGPCDCRHCRAKGALSVEEQTEAPVVHAPVELPAEPRPFRVHAANRPPQDCVLHPDGRMSMQAGGQTLWSMVSFDDMRDMNWRHAHIEWDPPPLAEEPAIEAVPEAVQDAIPLGTP